MKQSLLAAAALVLVTGWLGVEGQEAGKPGAAFTFKDVGDSTGLFPDVGGIRGHGAAWGDVDGDGYPDLSVVSFHDAGSKGGMFFRNDKGKFRLDPQEHVRTSGMGSGALFVDLTNSGKLDLFVNNCAMKSKAEVRTIPGSLFRNDGGGKFTDVTKESGTSLPLFAGRGLAALDYDGDGLLDIVMCERYYGPVKYGPQLFRNKGNHKFDNVTKEANLPELLSGLAIAVGDLNNDGWPDLFFTEGDGNHRLYLHDGKNKFVEAPGSRELFQWKGLGKEDTPAGVCIADLNRDGLPDIVIGHHYSTPWQKPARIRVYLNKGIKAGVPEFEEVTDAAGITMLPMKPPHLEVQDFDNDGWPDIYVSVVRFKNDQPYPVIYKNLGVKNGVPRLIDYTEGLNDFPTKEDLEIRGTTKLFDKILKDKKIIYMAAGPTADFDRDGKMDMFLANWWIESRSLLLRNETPGGNWLDVVVEGSKGVNRMGVGSKIRIFPAGKLADSAALLGCREIAIGYGYCSGQEAVAHFGLGKVDSVDLEVTLPHGKGNLVQKGVKANARVKVTQ